MSNPSQLPWTADHTTSNSFLFHDAVGEQVGAFIGTTDDYELNQTNGEAIIFAMNNADRCLKSVAVSGNCLVEIYRAMKAGDRARQANWFESVRPMMDPMMAKMEAEGIDLDKPFPPESGIEALP